MIEQTRFLSTVFLCSEFTLKNIYSAVNICRKMCAVTSICGNLFLWIAGKTAKIAKIRTRKNFVPHGILNNDITRQNFRSHETFPVLQICSTC